MVALGIDLGGTRIKVGTVDDGVVVASGGLPNRSTPTDLDAVAVLARRLADGRRIDGVGVAVPGVVRSDGRGMALAAAKYAYLETTDLVAWSLDAFGIPAVVENDARAALAGEVAAGCARGYDDVVMVILGTGIGTAATMGGVPVRGRSGHAGILGGHQTVAIDGPVCPCGNLGCGEALAATWNVADVVARARGAAGAGTDRAVTDPAATDPLAADGWRGLFAAAPTDPVAAVAVADAARVWAAVTASMVLAYDPELVVLSGGVLRAGDLVVPVVRDHLDTHLWGSMPRPRIAVAPDPEHSVVLGMATLASSAAHVPVAADAPSTTTPTRRPTPTLEQP